MENDLIRRKDAIELIRDHATSQGVNWVYAPRVLSLIRTVAPADAQPVRHGRWGEQHIIDYDGIHQKMVEACIQAAQEEGVCLTLIDKKFIADAIREKMEREGLMDEQLTTGDDD